MSPTRLRIREAQTLIRQARERTRLSIQSVLETANRILTFQLHSPDLLPGTWILYQRIVSPSESRPFSRETSEL
ncbi:MAG: hypothetical protein DMF84_05065 [Acidobacteria bacterium]|nr:MAG: hypothetical protein DMF84_05065 [Acidobacteriota bacterium]